jgi:hypothetical protein
VNLESIGQRGRSLGKKIRKIEATKKKRRQFAVFCVSALALFVKIVTIHRTQGTAEGANPSSTATLPDGFGVKWEKSSPQRKCGIESDFPDLMNSMNKLGVYGV